jgi:hypothetical protein
MRARLLTFAFPLVLLGCKKAAPAPAPAGSANVTAAASAATTPAAAPGQSLAILKDFEGQISWVVKGKLAGPPKPGAAPLNLALLVKGPKFRLDLPPGLPGAPPGASAYLLGSPKEKKLHVILDAEKQALLLDAEKLGAKLGNLGGTPGAPAAPGAGADAPKLTKTGKTDKVAGYSCEIWEIVHQTSKMETCIAAESTQWFEFPLANLPEQYAWAKELTDGKHFPLRFTTFDKSGAEEGRVELTSIEKKALDAKSFEIPAGYQIVDLEQMMAGMMQKFGGMHGRPGMPNLKGLPLTPPGTPSARVPPAPKAKASAAPKK